MNRDRSFVVPFGFAMTVSMWAVAYFFRLPLFAGPSWLLLVFLLGTVGLWGWLSGARRSAPHDARWRPLRVPARVRPAFNQSPLHEVRAAGRGEQARDQARRRGQRDVAHAGLSQA